MIAYTATVKATSESQAGLVNMSQVDFTVAIRTYNGEKLLPAVLERLRSQMGTEQISWEIVVVDNNSTDNTAKILQEYQSNWSQAYPLIYYFEPQQGAVFARLRAIKEARGTFIGFLDDDNFPTPNWVAAAYSFGKSHPKAGAFGGQIKGEFEVYPPENFERIQSFLALKERGSKPNLYDPENLSLPPGAGLVVQKQVWLDNVPAQLVLQGPVGSSLAAKGEDFEALLYIGRAGWEIWYNPEMCIYHQIPKWRLEKDYLITLIRGVGLSICQLRMINASNWQKPIIITRILLGNLRRAILQLIKYRGKLKTDLVAACEMEFFLSSLASPFYLFKKSMQIKFLTWKN